MPVAVRKAGQTHARAFRGTSTVSGGLCAARTGTQGHRIGTPFRGTFAEPGGTPVPPFNGQPVGLLLLSGGSPRRALLGLTAEQDQEHPPAQTRLAPSLSMPPPSPRDPHVEPLLCFCLEGPQAAEPFPRHLTLPPRVCEAPASNRTAFPSERAEPGFLLRHFPRVPSAWPQEEAARL